MKITLLLHLCILLPMLFPNVISGQPGNTSPKIGYAFSGGGAKGVAQVGVLRVLEDAGIRPDVVTGTSIGSIIGGLYAIGYSVDQLEELALQTDWVYYFDDELERIYFPIEERYTAERYQLRFPIDSGKIALPKGVVRGKKISLLLSRLTVPAHGISNFDDFRMPYRAVATDLVSGEAVVFSQGDLADAMRASMSIPSVFVPFEIGDHLLIDGGVVRNLPVSDAFDLGADTVIAIDIGASLYKKKDLTSILTVLGQTSSYLTAISNREQARLATLVIRPRIGEIGALSFNQNDRLMRRGKIAAQKNLPEVKELLGDRPFSPSPGVVIPDEILVTTLQITGCDEKSLKAIRSLLQIREGHTYSLDAIENRIKKLYGSELVALASYRIVPDGEGYQLTIKTETQPGEFLRLSANYDSRFKAGLLLNLTLRNRLFPAPNLTSTSNFLKTHTSMSTTTPSPPPAAAWDGILDT